MPFEIIIITNFLVVPGNDVALNVLDRALQDQDATYVSFVPNPSYFKLF